MHTRQSAVDALPALLDRRAERLVLVGFRCWMAGYEYRDIDCWETAWNAYAGELGSAAASDAVGALQMWVRALRSATVRTIRCFPHCCRHVCRDECMALSLISALQADDERIGRVAAHHLTGATSGNVIAGVIEAGTHFAASLDRSGLRLVPVTPDVVDGIAAFEEPGAVASTLIQ